MSQTTKDGGEDPDEEPSHSSGASSGSTCTSSSTHSSSGTCESARSDRFCCFERPDAIHRACRASSGCFPSEASPNQNAVASGESFTVESAPETKHICDSSSTTERPLPQRSPLDTLDGSSSISSTNYFTPHSPHQLDTRMNLSSSETGSQDVDAVESSATGAGTHHTVGGPHAVPTPKPIVSPTAKTSTNELVNTVTSGHKADIHSRRVLRPAPSPSPSASALDTYNYKRIESLSNFRRTNFSKSASGSRLVNKNRPNLCDCLKQDCEREHSSRRQFIENFYNSRTKLPSASTSTSSFNMITPLNKLSDCDAITKRLLSSPIRTSNSTEGTVHRTQVSEIDKSRRASLGTNTITDQVFLFAEDQFNSLELSNRINDDNDNREDSSGRDASSNNESELKLKQQGRSLSVCDEETLNPRLRSGSSNHSSILNRAISLACESGPSMRLLTIIPLFGCDIKTLEQFARFGLALPPVIDSAVDHILMFGVNSIGIFRKSGVKSRILNLRQRIENNQEIKIDEINRNIEFSIYDIADLVKMWFRELKPAPLLTKELIKLISNLSGKASHDSKVSSIKRTDSGQEYSQAVINRIDTTRVRSLDTNLKCKIDSLITSTQRALFMRVLEFFAKISSNSEVNQMTSQNLAICLTPSLCATEPDQNSILIAQKALELCIDNYQELFGAYRNG